MVLYIPDVYNIAVMLTVIQVTISRMPFSRRMALAFFAFNTLGIVTLVQFFFLK